MFGPHNPHRGLGPANSGNNRLTELLDQVRVEFESQARSSGEYEQQCELSNVPCMFAVHQAAASIRSMNTPTPEFSRYSTSSTDFGIRLPYFMHS